MVPKRYGKLSEIRASLKKVHETKPQSNHNKVTIDETTRPMNMRVSITGLRHKINLINEDIKKYQIIKKEILSKIKIPKDYSADLEKTMKELNLKLDPKDKLRPRLNRYNDTINKRLINKVQLEIEIEGYKQVKIMIARAPLTDIKTNRKNYFHTLYTLQNYIFDSPQTRNASALTKTMYYKKYMETITNKMQRAENVSEFYADLAKEVDNLKIQTIPWQDPKGN